MKTIYITDLDGTLLNSEKHVSAFTINVIRELTDCGELFTYATARSEESSLVVTDGIITTAPPIFYDGCVMGRSDDSVPPSRIFLPSNITDVISGLCDAGIFPIIYSVIDGQEKLSFIPEKSSPKLLEFALEHKEGCRRYRPVTTYTELVRGDIFYITCIDSSEKLLPFYEKYRDVFNCVYHVDIYYGSQWLEIMPRTANKANAAVLLKNRFDCDELVVFGDNKNDIELFKVADRAYAVANAVPELKAIATDIIESNNNDGVAHFIQKELKKYK